MLDALEEAPTECSFCKKAPEQIRKLIAAPRVAICDERVEVCVEMIAGPVAPGAEGKQGVQTVNGPLMTSLCSLCRMPVVVEELMQERPWEN